MKYFAYRQKVDLLMLLHADDKGFVVTARTDLSKLPTPVRSAATKWRTSYADS